MPIATRRPASQTTRAPATTNAALAPAKVLDIPFDMRGLAQQHSVAWDAKRKTYIWRGRSLPEALAPYASQPYSWERFQEDQLNDVEPTVAQPQAQIILHPHQTEAAARIKAAIDAGRSGFLNADDVGLGKTIETWQALLDTDWAETVLIVCPLSVVAHWRRTIQNMGDAGKRVVIINYDRLKKLFDVPAQIPTKVKRKKVRRVRTQKGVAKHGTAIEFDLIIFDESHRLRNVETARSKLALKLSGPADFILWLSATAGQNPLELAYLAPVLSEATGARSADLADFEKWCQSQGFGVSRGDYGKWLWAGNSDDAADRIKADQALERMRQMLFEGNVPIGIRRSPSDIAGWPSVNRILLPVDLDSDDRAAYFKIWAEFRDHLGLERRGGSDSSKGLVARLRFRQKASLLRTAATLDLGLELLSQGQQVAISVAFHETLDVLNEAFTQAGHSVALIHGKLNPIAKENQRLDFQHGRSRVCLYTVDEAISLHQGEYNDAVRSNLIHDLRWSAIQMKQIEGRTHRDGKFSQVYWMLGVDTIEEQIAEIVAGRLRSMSAMQGDQATIADVERMLASMARQ
jgi:hypothetical protein